MRLNPTSLFNSFIGDSFYLTINQEINSSYIVMGLYTPIVNTRYLPQTTAILKRLCPSVLLTKCFNEDNLPFAKEVKKTEIGHLFEHLLLEFICLEKIKGGQGTVAHNGRTDWNWVEDIEGVFHIYVDSGWADEPYFSRALEKTMSVVEQILLSSTFDHPYDQLPEPLH